MSVFSKILLKKPKYSYFDLSYDHKLSFKMGYLVPVHVQECMPGDNFKMSSQAMFRMMPMIAPIMHKVDVYMHFFFVPNRLVWPNWEKFITGGDDPDVSIPSFPLMNFPGGTPGVYDTVLPSSLANYLGLPCTNADYGTGEPAVSALPFAGYHRIWHEFYRDQNLDTSSPIELADGVQTASIHNQLCALRKRAWEHDYFTSCLPWPQKGDAVTIPLNLVSDDPNQGGLSPVISMPGAGGIDPRWENINGQPISGTVFGEAVTGEVELTGGVDGYYNPRGHLGIDPADLVGSATLNDLRTATALQRWLEKNARAGTRYIETLLAHFGVRSSDKRLQRPEYLGGSKANMAISEVLQTSQSDATPQGEMAGHGISVSQGKDFDYFCEEHGFIYGILSVRPKTAYYQGQPRFFSKISDRFEYPWPDFAQLGEQEVKLKELYVQSNPNEDNITFGYIPRYSEYRYNPSRVSGQMATTLEFWHMARKFAVAPALNTSFVEADPTKRIFAAVDPTEDEIVAHIYHNIQARRPLPAYGNPGTI